MQRIALGGISHETHGFSPTPTVLEDFALHRGEDILNHYHGHPSPLGGALEGLAQKSIMILPTLYATATPGGMVTQTGFTTLVGELVQRIRDADPDGILLALHGAMLAESILDCEGYLLNEIRQSYPTIPLVTILDLHTNISRQMAEQADLMVGYDENPHMDQYQRGLEAAQLLTRMMTSNKPFKAYRKVPLLLSPLTTWTKADPLAGALTVAHELEQQPGVWSITVAGGFPYADCPDIGASILAYADTQALAEACADRTAKALWSGRAAAAYRGFSPAEAVARAAFTPFTPALLADAGDNIGGGASGDATFLLGEMIHANVKGSLVVLNDPEAVAIARIAGEGGSFSAWVGGKTDELHGHSLPFTGTVVKLTDGTYPIGRNNHFAALSGSHIHMGDCALIRGDGIDLMLTSRRTPPGDVEMLTHMGIRPETYRMIAVKSAVAFRGAYETLAGEIIDVNTPGLCTCDMNRLPYSYPMPLYPLDTTIRYMEE